MTPAGTMANDLTSKEGKIRDLRNKIKKNGYSGRQGFERVWYRNALFYEGIQWISWFNSKKRWDKANIKNYIPKPVTNKIRPTSNSIISLFTQKEVRYKILPGDQTEEAIATAEVAESITDVLDKESGWDLGRKACASWGVITGNAFAYNYYDNAPDFGSTEVPMESCKQCKQVLGPDEIVKSSGGCPNCGGTDFEQATENGMVVTAEYPKGRLTTQILSPFNVYFNNELQFFQSLRQVVVSFSKPLEDLKRKYPDQKDKIKGVPDFTQEVLSEYYLTSLAYVNGANFSGFNTSPASSETSDKIEKAVVDIVFSFPTDDFNDGLYAVMIGDLVVESGELWSKTVEGEYYLPLSHFGAQYSPGKVWHSTPIDDLIQKQIQRNRFESLIELNIMRMGSADWTIPNGSNADRPTGEPGQIITYNPVGASGAKPEKVPGTGPHPSAVQMLQQIDKDFEELGGIFDILKGQIPKGLKAASGLKLLAERGFSRHMALINNWEDFNKSVKFQQLEIARQHFTEGRKKMLQDKLGVWEAKEFSKEDLRGKINVDVEAGSSYPRSQAAENALVLDLKEQGMIDVSDPHIHALVMQRLGQTDLSKFSDVDVKDAMREWKEFKDSIDEAMQHLNDPDLDAQFKTRFREDVDNHLIHYAEHVNIAKSPEFFELPKVVQEAWLKHLQLHKLVIMKAQAGAKPAPQGNPGPAAPPERRIDTQAAKAP